jgi:hypothetical protein
MEVRFDRSAGNAAGTDLPAGTGRSEGLLEAVDRHVAKVMPDRFSAMAGKASQPRCGAGSHQLIGCSDRWPYLLHDGARC